MPIFAEFVGTQHLWDLYSFVTFGWVGLQVWYQQIEWEMGWLVASHQDGKAENWGKKDKTGINRPK